MIVSPDRNYSLVGEVEFHIILPQVQNSFCIIAFYDKDFRQQLHPVTFVVADFLNITIASWTIEEILNLMDQSSFCFYLSLRVEPVMLEFGLITSENGFFLNMNGDWAALSV